MEKMNIELKRAIVNWYCDNFQGYASSEECVRVFKAYIYDEKGEYLIGGKEVFDFIHKIRSLIYY